MRFKVCCENEDVNERSSGLISDVSEVDPIRWPGSKWRCLLVQWNGDTNCNHKNRVSPWEIERVGGTISVTQHPSSSSKRTKLCFPQGDLDTSSIDGNGRPDSMATESFHRVLQGQELLRSGSHHGVACSHPPGVPKFQNSDQRRFSADMRNCLFNGAESGLRPWNSTEFPYCQPLGFGESVGFSGVLQGQEMPGVVPLYHGSTSDACTWNDRVGSSDYVHWQAATQGHSLPRFTPPPAEVRSPSSVLTCNQTTVPQPEFEGPVSLNDAYSSRCAPLHQMLQGRTEDWPSLQQHQTPCVTGSNRFDMTQGSAPSDVGKPGSVGSRDVERSSCRLFGFSLTEKILVAEDDGVEEESYGADGQTPRVLDLFGHGPSTPSALHALCTAPLGL